jgi:hypothetical protein
MNNYQILLSYLVGNTLRLPDKGQPIRLFRDLIDVCSENRPLCGQNAKFLMLKQMVHIETTTL